MTAYNPFGGFTNAGDDWYFENRANDDADDWIAWVSEAGSDTFLTIPAFVYIFLLILHFTQISLDNQAGLGIKGCNFLLLSHQRIPWYVNFYNHFLQLN